MKYIDVKAHKKRVNNLYAECVRLSEEETSRKSKHYEHLNGLFQTIWDSLNEYRDYLELIENDALEDKH